MRGIEWDFNHPHLRPLPLAGEEVKRIPKEVDCFCTRYREREECGFIHNARKQVCGGRPNYQQIPLRIPFSQLFVRCLAKYFVTDDLSVLWHAEAKQPSQLCLGRGKYEYIPGSLWRFLSPISYDNRNRQELVGKPG